MMCKKTCDSGTGCVTFVNDLSFLFELTRHQNEVHAYVSLNQCVVLYSFSIKSKLCLKLTQLSITLVKIIYENKIDLCCFCFLDYLVYKLDTQQSLNKEKVCFRHTITTSSMTEYHHLKYIFELTFINYYIMSVITRPPLFSVSIALLNNCHYHSSLHHYLLCLLVPVSMN